MSERFAAASGRKVVSRTSAEELGKLAHIVIDAKRRQVTSLVVGKGRKALLIAWDQVSGFGPDAVMIADETALHEPRGDREHADADGKRELVGKRTLSDAGNASAPSPTSCSTPTPAPSKASWSTTAKNRRPPSSEPARSPSSCEGRQAGPCQTIDRHHNKQIGSSRWGRRVCR